MITNAKGSSCRRGQVRHRDGALQQVLHLEKVDVLLWWGDLADQLAQLYYPYAKQASIQKTSEKSNLPKEVYSALSSEVRAEILKLTYQKPRQIEELAESLNLQPVTIRHHIQILLEVGILEFHEERNGLVGRPKTFFTIAEKPPAVAFPARAYFELSKTIVKSLRKSLGEKKTEEVLAEAGRELGRETIKFLEAKNDLSEWTAKEFAEIVVKHLQEAGAEPEIVELSDNKLVYRLHNCLFAELSKVIPELLCDVMHHEYQQAMLDSIQANVKGIQTSCMGHGDVYCEHVIEWVTRKEIDNRKK